MPCVRASESNVNKPKWARETIGRINKCKLRTIKLASPERKSGVVNFASVREKTTMYGCSCDGTCKSMPIKGVLHFDVKKDLTYCAECFKKVDKEEGKFVECKNYGQVMKELFDLMDLNHDGTISREEFNIYFKKMGASDKEINKMFSVASPQGKKKYNKKFFPLDGKNDAKSSDTDDGLSLEAWADFYLRTFVFF